MFHLRLTVFVESLAAIVLLAACAQATIAPTSTVAPTSTPTPAPTPTRMVSFSVESIPSPDPEWSGRLTELLSLIPIDHNPVIFLDVASARANADIQQALDLEVLGLLDTLQPGASTSVDSAVVAFRRDGNGLVTIIRGAVDVDGLLTAASGLGLVAPGPKPKKYRGYEVRNVDVFGIFLAFASVDDSTLVIATGSPSGATTGPDLIRESLDSYDGVSPRLLEDPETAHLINELPAGVTAVVLGDCANLTVLFFPDTLRGCTGAAISAAADDAGQGAINAVVGYEDEAHASAANELMRVEGFQFDDPAIRKAAIARESSVLRLRLPANVNQAALALDTLGRP